MLTLSATLSGGAANASEMFSVVFVMVGFGVVVLMVNVLLLGGKIIFL